MKEIADKLPSEIKTEVLNPPMKTCSLPQEPGKRCEACEDQ